MSEDTIYRQDALDAVTKAWTKYMPMDIDISGSFILGTLMDLPSAQPERKKGRWIEHKNILDTTYECNQCGKLVINHVYNYCPNCGAKMDERSDDEQQVE